MTTHLIKPGCSVTALSMRCGLVATDAGDDTFGSEDSINVVDCPGCLRDLILDMRRRSMGAFGESPEGRWLAGGDTGISSKVIWSVMMGQPFDGGRWYHPDIPHDPSDFGRCHRLLELFPAWRARLSEVASAHPDWSGLVGAWDELTALYVEELPTGSGPKLYARMRELSDD